jgi:hypothetical protein
VVTEAVVAANDVLEQAQRLVLDQLPHHRVEHRHHRHEALVGLTYKSQAALVQEDLLHNENSHLIPAAPPLRLTHTHRHTETGTRAHAYGLTQAQVPPKLGARSDRRLSVSLFVLPTP